MLNLFRVRKGKTTRQLIVLLVGFVALTTSVLSVKQVVSQTPSEQEAGVSAEVTSVVKGNNTFALNLYSQLHNQKGNLFISPYSISTGLAMTYAGARGETATQTAKTLHFTLEPERLHPAFAKLIARLGAGNQQELQLFQANRLWGQKGYSFFDVFRKTTQNYYRAGLEEVDFKGATELSRRTINARVAQQTQEKIQDTLAPGTVSPSSRLVLTNAIYFKGGWAFPFEPKQTINESFTIAPGQQVQVPMMNYKPQEFEFGYAKHDGLQLLELFYAYAIGENEGHVEGNISMVVLLPEKVDGLAELEQRLTLENLEQWVSSLKRSKVEVSLPKFKIESALELNKMLSQMGMLLAFSDGGADFSGMNGKKDLSISTVVHKTFVNVDEKGTEASAATGVGIDTADFVQNTPPPRFKADHPFIFLIRDRPTGSILFLGRLLNPLS